MTVLADLGTQMGAPVARIYGERSLQTSEYLQMRGNLVRQLTSLILFQQS